ncbi:uncharacterized protein LOC116307562 [Actinia tenebrosa]|uniref:Uncharacterized protein LOC116307562 n=1 Tax=Actinia tenebrosa TaxID=6105 RepID=A0A6P8J1C8_ACTTE|nr:uncharacterized protein LOC116307562 [Actinia tenebrosa]
MGAEESHIPLKRVPQSFGYLAVVFKMPDNIQVIHGGENEHSVIEHVISNTWKEGIQATKQKCAGSVLCFKLNGLPYETGMLSLNIREVACRILRCLHNIGWQYLVAANLTKCRQWFTLIFVHKETQRISQELAYVAMSSNDKLHFCNLQQHTLDEICHSLRHSEHQPGITFEDSTDGLKNYEVQLNGLLWSSTTALHAEARAILTKIFIVMMKRYSFLCAMNLKRTEDAFVFVPKSIHYDTTTEFFIISLRKTSKIQVYKEAPDHLIPIIHLALVDAFGKMSHAIEKIIDHQSGKVEFKYKSHTEKDPDALCTMTKFIVCKLLEALKSHGWSIVTGFDMSRKLSNKSELLFQKSSPHPDCKVFCLSPVRKSKLCVINAPPKIINACRKVISTRWHLPLISETQYAVPATCVSFELGGKPWSDSSDCAYFSHSMFLHLLEEFFHKGFKINLTADVIPESMEYDEGVSSSHDPNAWWFMLEPQIVMTDASYPGDWKSEVPPLAQVLSDDFRQTPVPDVHVNPNEPQNRTEPMMPTDTQLYEDCPPSYEMIMMEREQKQD